MNPGREKLLSFFHQKKNHKLCHENNFEAAS
jgi:hypothetical protein